MRASLPKLFCALALTLPVALSSMAQAADTLTVQGSIKAADGGWDYATVDAAAHRLYVARGTGLLAVDLASGSVTDTLTPGKRLHGVIMLPNGQAMITNGDSNEATLFTAASGAVLGSFPAGQKPDALIREGKTGLVAVMNHGDGTVTLIDIGKKQVVGSLTVGGTLEFAATDDDGHVYVNVEDKNELVGIDIAGRKLLGHHPLPDCDEPTGLAIDKATHVLLSACGNGKAVALSAIDGHVLAALPIGKGADAVLFDEKGKRFLVPCGSDGVLSVINEAPDGTLTPGGSVPTAKGARTGAIDSATGKVYLPTADFAPAKDSERAERIPGTFRILVLG